MRIDSIFIDGFGVWHESLLKPDPGLTVVCGDNEAGKTTLLAFVRSILFGFETNQHPAVAGGRRGGWLDVSTADDRHFRIERYGERGGQGALTVTGEDGVDRGPEFLPRLLHGVEASVYRNVFAFRLDELTELKGLTEGGAAARIYGAGLGTGAASALSVEAALKTEAAARFKPGGSNPRINQLLKQIEEVERELTATDLPAEYGAARGRLADREMEGERLATELESLRSERRRLERIDAGWQPTQELRAAEESLGAEPDPGPGLEGALERFTRLEAALKASEERHADVAGRLEGRRSARRELRFDEKLVQRRAEIERLLAVHATVRGEAGALVEAEQQLTASERQLAETLGQLGDGWTAERVAALDLSVANRAALGGRFRDLIDGAARDLERREIEAATAEAAAADASFELASLDQRSVTGALDPAVTPASPRTRLRWLAAAGAVASVGLAMLLVLTGAMVAAAALAVVGMAAAAAWLALRRGPIAGGMAAARRAAVEERRAMATDRLGHALRTRDSADRALATAQAASANAHAEWRDWLTGNGYEAELDRETVLSVFEAAAGARATIRRRGEAADAVARLSARRDSFVQEARVALADLGRGTKPDSVAASLDALAGELQDAVSARQESVRLEQEEQVLAAEESRAAERREGDAAALAGLLEGCGVSSEADLRERVARLDRRRGFEEAASRARNSLAILSGHGSATDRLAAEIGAVADIGEARERLAAVRGELETSATARDGILQEIGALQSQIETLEASVEASAARQRHADLVSRLEAEAEDWSVRRLALSLMERTRQRYEREHRPGVIRAAEEYMSDWTDGRWARIVAPLGGAIDGLERADGRQVPIAALSRGTQEQLYLALRFGLIEHFADEAEPLPIVMDETLVNFDEARAERTARTIEQLSARHQILYFTYRSETQLRSATVIRLQPPTLAGAVGADRPPTVEHVPV